MTDQQKLSQLQQAREEAYRRGDDEAEAWYEKEIKQLTQTPSYEIDNLDDDETPSYEIDNLDG